MRVCITNQYVILSSFFLFLIILHDELLIVSVGDCVLGVEGQERVVEVEVVRGEGVYTVVTNQVDNCTLLYTHLLCFHRRILFTSLLL
jgi:hypothetical protein